MLERFSKWAPVGLTRSQPTRSIILIVALMTLFLAINAFLPSYSPVAVAALFKGVALQASALLTGLFHLFTSLPALYGVWKNDDTWMKRGAILLFCWWLFIAMMRLIVIPYTPRLLWLLQLAIALICAVCFLERTVHKVVTSDSDTIQ